MNQWKKQLKSASMVCLLALAPAVAQAVDGVIEINEAAVAVGGITSGDGSGYPVTISESGSYRLTGNLTISNTVTNAISVTADNVTIDLNGFSIIGPGSGSGNGIQADTNLSRVTVTNGNVVSMGSRGIWLFSLSSQVIGVVASDNGSFGIQMGDQSLVRDSSANDNGKGGILVSEGGVVANSSADGNAEDGIQGGHAANIFDSSATSNGGHGIRVITGSLVRNNTSRFNQGFGLLMLNGSAYSGNVMTANIGGDVSGGVQTGPNLCNNSNLCP